MSILQRVFIFVAFLLVMSSSLLHAQVIEDFQQDSKWRVASPGKLESGCKVVDSPMRQGKSLQISWGVPRDKYFEVLIASKRPVIEGFEKSINPFHATASIDVFSPGTSELHRMAIRFIDSDGEVFQWSSRVQIKEEGWQTLTIPITPDNFIVSWGGKPENKGKIEPRLGYIMKQNHLLMFHSYRNLKIEKPIAFCM